MNRLSLIIFLFFPSLILAMGSYSISPEKNQATSMTQNASDFSTEGCCKGNWEVFADLLYWHAGEVGTIPNSTIAVSADPNLVTKLHLNNLDFKWDFGYRVGGRFSNDQWGLSLYYTWYRTEAKNHATFEGFVGIPSGFPLTGTITDASFLNLFWLFGAHKFHARWNLLYNLFDFDLDREYLVSKTISLRPYLGLRGGWIYQNIHIHSTYNDPLDNNMAVPANEELKNHFWGIGPSLGLDSKWCLGKAGEHFFYLFGDLSSAFMWSHWSFSNQLSISNNISGELEIKHRYAGSLTFRNLVGFEWNVKLNSCGSMLCLRFGFESQFWFDNLQIFNAYNGRQHNALTLQGGTFDFQFNY